MAHVLILLAVLNWSVGNVTPFDKMGDTLAILACSIGDIIQNEEVKCVCTEKNVYSCVEKQNSSLKHSAVKFNNYKPSCDSNKVYIKDSLICICNKNGTWPHKKCGKAFKSLSQKELIKSKCEPNSYKQIDCNICRCDSNGNIDAEHCTQNECDNNIDPTKHRRSTDGTKLYGDCESRNWYSLAPCQFCYCVKNNKLVCNTGTSLTTNKMYLQLGSYNLHICGKKLINELMDLVRENEALLRQGDESYVISSAPSTISSVNSLVTEPIRGLLNMSPKTEDTINIKEKKSYNTDIDSSSQSEEEINIENNRDMKIYSHVSTQLPRVDSQNEEALKIPIGRQSDNDNDDSDSSNEITDADKRKGLILATTYKPGLKSDKKLGKELGGHFEINLPMVLSKVFKMAMRKSMVSLKSDKTCVPGAVETVACNTCFCLKNAKMLCTDNKCKTRKRHNN